MAILSDEAKKLGINLGYDAKTKNVTVGDKTYTPDQLKGAGLTLSGGRWQGDTTSLLNPTPQVSPAQQMMSETQPTYQAPDYSSYVNSLAEQTKAKNVADLQRAYEKSIGSLNQEQTTIAPKFEQGRSDTRRLAINQAKDFENFLATKGLSASGTAGQGMIQQQGQLLGSIGQSKTAEGNANADIERRRSGLTTDLQYGIQSAQANADLEAARQLTELRQQQDTRAYNESQTASDRAYQEGLTAQDIARETAQNTQNRTRQDFINTLGGIRDYTAQISNVQNDGDPSNDWQIPFLQQAKQEKIVNQNLDPKTGKPLPVDNTQQVWDAAYKKWNAGIPLTQQEMGVIGATTPTKPKTVSSSGGSGSKTTITQDRNYQEDRWQRLGKADKAIADAWGVPVGTPFSSKPVEVEPVDTSTYENYINKYLSDDVTGQLDKGKTALYLIQNAVNNPNISDDLEALGRIYGVTEQDFNTAMAVYKQTGGQGW